MTIMNIYPVLEIATGRTLGSYDTPEEALAAVSTFDCDCQAMIMPDDFRRLSEVALVTAYNVLSVRSVQKFETKEVGVARLRKFLQPNNFTFKDQAVNPQEGSKMAKASKKKVSTKKVAKKKVVKQAVVKTKRAVAKAKRAVAGNADYKNVSQMFRTLIAAGKLSDDEIFAAVQKAFGVADDKRRYVAWYRKDIERRGR